MRADTDIQNQPPQEPPAPPERGSGARPPWRLLIAGLLLAGLAWLAVNAPIPVLYAYEPGPVRDIAELIDVSGDRTYSSDGDLYLTTVSLDIDVTFVEWVQAAFDPTKAIVSRDEVTGGRSFEELESEQLEEMESSKQQAGVVALSALGYPEPTADGAEIVEVFEGAPADGVLETGDVITSVDGHEIETTCDAIEMITRAAPGDDVELGVERNGEREVFVLPTGDNPQSPGTPYIGIRMTNKDFEYDPGVDVTFKTDEIAGPSAGLMFSLTLYDQLTPDDLTHGHKIAGTGTIGCDGEIGAIGGIQQKIAAAEDADADVFLAPAGNQAAANEAADDIRVVGVANFRDALGFLEDLD